MWNIWLAHSLLQTSCLSLRVCGTASPAFRKGFVTVSAFTHEVNVSVNCYSEPPVFAFFFSFLFFCKMCMFPPPTPTAFFAVRCCCIMQNSFFFHRERKRAVTAPLVRWRRLRLLQSCSLGSHVPHHQPCAIQTSSSAPFGSDRG